MAEIQQGTLRALMRLDMYLEWLKIKSLKRVELCDRLTDYIRTKVDVSEHLVKETITKFIKNLELRWKMCHRIKERFQTQNSQWLHTELVFPEENIETGSSKSRKRGRPLKKFEECGVRRKQIRAKQLLQEKSVEELAFATQVALRGRGERSAASVLHDVTATTPKRAQKYRRAYLLSGRSGDKPIAYTPEEALSLIINAKLGKQQYLLIRSEAKNHNVKVYPSWNAVITAKNRCYPENEVTENSAQVKLQDILDITTKRICCLQEEVIKTTPTEITSLTLICKWGCDGSSGQSNYKQRFSGDGQDDSSVFIVSFVPLQLFYPKSNEPDDKVIVWQNPCPSSTRFCRPIKFTFFKETPETTQREIECIQQQISELCPTEVSPNIIVNYNLLLTMVDGKVCNSLTDTRSTQVCYICKAKPSEMNDLQKISAKISDERNYTFGLSILHSWIRFFECCLHISYRLEVKTWQARGPNKNKIESRKKEIIEKLRKELGLLVDQPKSGFGSTNDGNTARRFFRDPKLSSSITGVSQEIINRFSVILRVISSGFEISHEKFDIYTKETARIFVQEYPWYYMPTSVHKVLMHGSEVIKNAILPIGQLSEEAQEAKNKDFKYVREHHTRKMSRSSTNEDLFNYLILSSDPIISTISRKTLPKYKNIAFTPEVLNLLTEPNIQYADSDSDGQDFDE